MKLLTVVAFALVAGIGAAVAQDKPVELKFSHWVPATHPIVKASEQWADSIKKASNGTISITIYPAQQLGKAFDHYDMARDGIADITYANPGYAPGRFPVIAAGELPFLLANAKEGSAALDSWYRKYAPKEMAEVRFCIAFVHDPGTFHSTKKKIVVPADVAGMKIRPAGATIARFVTLLGGANVQASAVEARDVLEKNVADGITFPWGSIVLFGMDKVLKYHIDTALYTSVQTWVMNKAKYEAMSPAQKKVIDDHCTTEWALKIAAPWADFEAGGRDKIKAMAGQEVYALTPDQFALWRAAAQPLIEEWGEPVRKAGYDPKAALDELKASAVKYNSAY
ncbi:MAG: TRAP transporter substrate-binding protein [Xanthobacteraceae bacterium]